MQALVEEVKTGESEISKFLTFMLGSEEYGVQIMKDSCNLAGGGARFLEAQGQL